jgi:hypothetical protein
MGFVELMNQESMYYHKEKGIRMSIHVDDPFIVFDKLIKDYVKIRNAFKAELESKFVLKGWTQLLAGVELDYLSMRVTAGTDGKVRIDNDRFVQKLLEKYQMADCNPTVRPMTRELLQLLQKEKEEELLTDDAGTTKFKGFLGDINWLNQTTHPGLAVAVALYGSLQCPQAPLSYEKAIKTVMRFLKGTVGKALMAVDDSGMVWRSDSDWAGLYGVTGSTKSRGGRIGLYNGMPVEWTTEWIGIRQSSAEAEAFEMSQCVKAAMAADHVLDELDVKRSKMIKIGVDASAAISFANNTASAGRMKHIDVRCDWVRMLRSKGRVEFVKVDGTDNIADFMTKILSGPEFERQHCLLMHRVEHHSVE